MAMASTFETVLLHEHFNPIVKLEPLYNDDQTEDSSHTNQSKIEFSLFVQFAAHVQHHLNDIYSQPLDHTPYINNDAVDIKPLLVECDAEPFDADAAIQSDDDYTPSKKRRKITKKVKLNFKCTECDQYFEHACLMTRHRARVHDGKAYRCVVCKITTGWKYNIQRHMKTLHPNNDSYYSLEICYSNKNASLVECFECDRTFAAEPLLKDHWHSAHCCQVCNLIVKNLRQHMTAAHQNSHKITQHRDDDKQKITSDEYQSNAGRFDAGPSLPDSLLPQHSNEDQKEPIDGIESGNSDAAVQLPVRQKNELGLYECSDCDQSFRLYCKLTRHRDLVHCGKKFCCKICDVKVSYKFSMERHMSSVHPQQPQDLYEETFYNDGSRKKKKVKDDGGGAKKPTKPRKNQFGAYDCGDCDMSFKLWCKLRRHRELVHCGKMFCCTLCGMKVCYKYSIERHMSTVHPLQPQNLYEETFNNDIGQEKMKRKGERPNSKLNASDDIEAKDATPKSDRPQKNENGVYECSDCDQTFKFYCHLTLHRNVVHAGRKFCCQLCGAKVNYKYSIERHMLTSHPGLSPTAFVEILENGNSEECPSNAIPGTSEFQQGDIGPESRSNENDEAPKWPGQFKRKFKCVKCNKSFGSLLILRQHRIVHSMAKKYKCRHCNAGFAYINVLRSHMANKHAATHVEHLDKVKDEVKDDKNRPYQCPICKLRYGFRRTLEKHLQTIHPKVKFEFKTANGPSSTDDPNSSHAKDQKIIIEDIRVGRRYEKSICAICKEEFKNKWALAWHNRHLSVCDGRARESFECYACHIKFETLAELNDHFRRKHIRVKYKLRPCAACGKQFDDPNLFKEHRRWHKEQLIGRPHKCHACDKSFVERFQLARHAEQHLTTRDFACEICGKAYKTLKLQKRHLRRHTGELRVQCEECGKILGDSGRLKRHMLTHSDESPFECEYCHKRFRQHYSMVIHKRSHTGEYIHYCKPCKKGFGLRRELRKHNLRVHGIEAGEENDLK